MLSLRRFVFALATLLIIACVTVVLLQGRRDAGVGPIASDTSSAAERIERGRYLAIAGNCASCHTAPGGDFMAGGLPFETPFGTIYSTNITPDPQTGIGSWSDWDFLNSLRHGIRSNGQHLYPVFPYTAYTKVSNADVAALYAYFMSIPAVRADTPTNELGFPFQFRPLLAFWKALFFKPGAFEPVPDRTPTWNRGAYLVEALAHCGACHTPRNALGAMRTDYWMSGGELLGPVGEGDVHRPWSAPSLLSDDRALGLWPEEELRAYLATARNSFLESYGPMNEVIMNSTRYLESKDIEAMADYLKNLPAGPDTSAPMADARLMGRGRTIYNLHCGTCHLPTGEGDPEMAPRLSAGSLVVQSDDPASMINAILYGPEAPRPPLPPRWREPMDEFRYILDDEDVAAVATYIRQSWSNTALPVSPAQVARQRAETE